MDDPGAQRLEKAFRIATIAILVVSLGAAVLWILFPGRLNLEPALVLLGLLYAAVPLAGNGLVRRLNRDLTRERWTLPYALAYGYLTNYLAPVVRQLRRRSDAPDEVAFYVYIPRALDELRGDAIDELLSELKNRKYVVETLELDFPGEKRKKDYRTARRLPNGGPSGAVKYFDFPTTLRTLEPAVEFKLDTRENESPARQREELGLGYIADFRHQLEQMLATRTYEAIRSNIHIVDGGLDFLEKA